VKPLISFFSVILPSKNIDVTGFFFFIFLSFFFALDGVIGEVESFN
jgi:hypothetical protein